MWLLSQRCAVCTRKRTLAEADLEVRPYDPLGRLGPVFALRTSGTDEALLALRSLWSGRARGLDALENLGLESFGPSVEPPANNPVGQHRARAKPSQRVEI